MTDQSSRSDALWSYAVEFYGNDGVADACLRLQDEQGADVPVVLACAWAATRVGATDSRLVCNALDATGRWRSTVVEPLRSVRRSLKSPIEGFDDEARTALRTDVAELELAAERQQLDVLQAMILDLPTEPVGQPLPMARRLLGQLASWPPPTDLSQALESVATIVAAAVPQLDRAIIDTLAVEAF